MIWHWSELRDDEPATMTVDHKCKRTVRSGVQNYNSTRTSTFLRISPPKRIGVCPQHFADATDMGGIRSNTL